MSTDLPTGLPIGVPTDLPTESAHYIRDLGFRLN